MLKIITLITQFIAAALASLFFASCSRLSGGTKGSGDITTETRTVNQNFKNIKVSHGIRVVVEQADNELITVETDDNLQQHIITKIENGVLKIEADESYHSSETPVVKIKMPVISGLSADSGSEITSSNVLITENITIEASSGSEISIDTEADFIKIKSSGGSNVEVNGKALRLETSSSGGSDIDAEKLMTNEVTSKAVTGSKTSVYPILKLEAKASSGGNIEYHKNPKTISKTEESGGSVDKE